MSESALSLPEPKPLRSDLHHLHPRYTMLKDYREFAIKGNVVDMAVGIIIGGAFGTIARSLVEDVIMPPIGLLLGGVEFQDMFSVLRTCEPAGPYLTLAAAQEAARRCPHCTSQLGVAD